MLIEQLVNVLDLLNWEVEIRRLVCFKLDVMERKAERRKAESRKGLAPHWKDTA